MHRRAGIESAMPQIGEEHDNHADESDEFEDRERDGAGAWWHGGCVWAGVGGAGYMYFGKVILELISKLILKLMSTRLVGLGVSLSFRRTEW